MDVGSFRSLLNNPRWSPPAGVIFFSAPRHCLTLTSPTWHDPCALKNKGGKPRVKHPKRNAVRTYVDDATREKLQALAAEIDRPVSYLLRHAIQRLCDR